MTTTTTSEGAGDAGMTLMEGFTRIGQTAALEFADSALRMTVVLKEVKSSYGRIRFLVTPVAGDGETWVEIHRLVFEGEGRYAR